MLDYIFVDAAISMHTKGKVFCDQESPEESLLPLLVGSIIIPFGNVAEVAQWAIPSVNRPLPATDEAS